MKADLDDVYKESYEIAKVFCGEERIAVGENHVTAIKYHIPRGEGDRHFVDVYFDNEGYARVFDISYIEFKHISGKNGG